MNCFREWRRAVTILAVSLIGVASLWLMALELHFKTEAGRFLLTPPRDPAEPSTEICTTSLFREHHAREGYFLSTGSWIGRDPSARYEPDLCHFRWASGAGNSTVEKCFALKNITSIVVLGASQGKRYAKGALKQVQLAFPDCQIVKSESQIDKTPEASYFAHGDADVLDHLSVQAHHCKNCRAIKWVCRREGREESVTLESFGMDDLLDSTLRFYVPEARENSIETYQEFLFRHYLARDPPDLVIISPTLNHAKFKSSPDKFAADLTYFRSLMRIYLPPSTRTLWVPGMSEHEAALDRSPKYKNRRVDGLLASEAIDRLNHVLYKILEQDLLNPDDRTMGFLDMVQTSATCPAQWWKRLDGVHMPSFWYDNMMTYVFQLLCGDIGEKNAKKKMNKTLSGTLMADE